MLADLPYGDKASQTYDLYLPADLPKGQPCALVLWVHGGGFTGGDKADDVAWCRYPAARGMVCASMNYTFLSLEGNGGIPQMVREMELAVEVIFQKAGALGYPLAEMATAGTSAGGCLTMLYAYGQPAEAPIPVRFVFQQTGPASFDPTGWGNTTPDSQAAFATVMTGQAITAEEIESGAAQPAIDAISPAALVREGTVPTLMAYGPRDKVVPTALKYRLLEALQQYRVPYTCIEFPHSGHGLLNDLACMQQYVEELDRYIGQYFETM